MIQPTVNTTFREAEVEYTEASNAWALATEGLRDSQAALREVEREMEVIESFSRLTDAITGKNAEERTAQLMV